MLRILSLLWPPKLRIRFPNRKSTATDMSGRRYGDYFWLGVSFGHWHCEIWPRHVRRCWMSQYLREAIAEWRCKYLGKPYRESKIGKFSGREIHVDNDDNAIHEVHASLNEKEPEHVLYETGDADAPDAIKDRNGDVVLALCRNCGKGEIDLHGSCRNQKESAMTQDKRGESGDEV